MAAWGGAYGWFPKEEEELEVAAAAAAGTANAAARATSLREETMEEAWAGRRPAGLRGRIRERDSDASGLAAVTPELFEVNIGGGGEPTLLFFPAAGRGASLGERRQKPPLREADGPRLGQRVGVIASGGGRGPVSRVWQKSCHGRAKSCTGVGVCMDFFFSPIRKSASGSHTFPYNCSFDGLLALARGWTVLRCGGKGAGGARVCPGVQEGKGKRETGLCWEKRGKRPSQVQE